MRKFKSGFTTPTAEDLEFERAILDYRNVILKIRKRAIAKYGKKAERWFAK